MTDEAEVARAYPQALETPPETLSPEELRKFAPFSELPDTVLRKIQPYVLPALFRKGDVILREGEYSDAAYFLADGVVEVTLTRLPRYQKAPPPSKGGERQTATSPGVRAAELAGRPARERSLGSPISETGTVILSDMPVKMDRDRQILLEPGEIFGEISALSRYPVSATVQARTDVRCVLIRTPALRILQRSAPAFKEFVDRRYRDRALGSHLHSVPLFAGCDDRFIDEIRDKVELVSFEPGEQIVEEGSAADAFFLVRGGYVKVSARSGAGDLALTYLRKGDYFGEAAILLDEAWPFSFSAIDSVELIRLSRTDFEALLDLHPDLKRELWSVSIERLKQRGASVRRPADSEYLQMAMQTGLIHGESVLLIDLETCTRCDDCVRACAATHGGTPRFIREGFKFRNWLVPTACYQCTDPVCMIGCPTGAITRPMGTTEVSIDPATCIGCGNCGRRCPWGNIIDVPFQSATLKKEIPLATKCDLCLGRSKPACVQMCPHGSAIRVSFKDVGRLTALLPVLG